jgi:hypothetical protein
MRAAAYDRNAYCAKLDRDALNMQDMQGHHEQFSCVEDKILHTRSLQRWKCRLSCLDEQMQLTLLHQISDLR